jgi:hypothetical protein
LDALTIEEVPVAFVKPFAASLAPIPVAKPEAAGVEIDRRRRSR